MTAPSSNAPLKTILITGGSRGLGLATARALARNPRHRVVIAVRDLAGGNRIAEKLGSNVSAKRLNLADLADVERFIADWQGPVDVLMNNAGLQIRDATRTTVDGWEETFAVNHLAALRLTMGLLPKMRGGKVLFIGSGTHDPGNSQATRFGFRGAQFTTIDEVARGGNLATPLPQLGLDRYATSKFLNTITAVELARRIDPGNAEFFTLDPGLMPGTGLARTAPFWMRVLWVAVLPVLARFMAQASTATRSGKMAAWIVTSNEEANGSVFSHDRSLSACVWEKVRDPEIGRRVIDDSLALLEKTGHSAKI